MSVVEAFLPDCKDKAKREFPRSAWPSVGAGMSRIGGELAGEVVGLDHGAGVIISEGRKLATGGRGSE